MRGYKKSFLFFLIICLLLLSGWGGRGFPARSTNAGGLFLCVSGQASAGMKSGSGLDRAVFLSGGDWAVGHELTGRALVPSVQVGSRVFSTADPAQTPDPFRSKSANDQLGWSAMAPRA